MSIAQQVLPEKIINYLDSLIVRGRVKLNGEYKNYEIFKTVKDGNSLKKYLYLETEMGFIEEAQLISSAGEVLAVKPFAIDKQDDGLVLAFEFIVDVKEG